MFPLTIRIGSQEEFAAARAVFTRTGYVEKAVCERYGVKAIREMTRVNDPTEPAEAPGDGLGVLCQLFLDGRCVGEAEIERLLPEGAGAALERLGLIVRSKDDERKWCASVFLCPTNDVLLASDRWTHPDGSPFHASEDIVYPGHVQNTQLFLSVLPESPCEHFLDLCAGSGIAGMVASRYARKVSSFDIAERSTRFAGFNAKLNGICNLTTGTGDLYEPAGEEGFDRIAAHPPYVPVHRPRYIFDSGGEDGEQVTRRIVEGLPRYLRPGGRFYAVCFATERKGADLNSRLREWLGEAQGEFDTALVIRKRLTPTEMAEQAAIREGGGRKLVLDWEGTLARLEVESAVYGAIVIQRRTSARAVFDVRRESSNGSGREEIEWLIRWETRSREEGAAELILGSRFQARRATSFHVAHRLEGNRWVPDSYSLDTEYPFAGRSTGQPWTALLVARCDGSRTGMELYESLRAEGVLSEQVTAVQFAAAVQPLISIGYIELDRFSLPRAEG
ncbi:MAG: methyltransferase [Bryobacteraceae bacterium]